MPWCVQSFPSWGRMWPRASDLDPRGGVTPRQPHVALMFHAWGPVPSPKMVHWGASLPGPCPPSTEGGTFPGPPSSPPTRPHLVMVPSMSEMTTLSSHFHR